MSGGRDVNPAPVPISEMAEAPGASPDRMDAIARLAGVVSHDFSNLLTVILGHADMLLDVSGGNDAVRSSVIEIKNAAESGARVANDLMAISRRQSLRPTPVDINAIVRNLSETLCQIVGEQIDVRFDLAADLPLVEVDPVQYERVLRSIAVHAREVMPQSGRLTFVTAVERQANHTNVVLRVRDTAASMSSRTAEPIFTGKKPSRGAGLALTTAYGIVMQSGGTLTVEQQTGRGGVITVSLPARDAGGFLPRA
jgi:two-component system cell cycle sensor histidine kinase/response regulator CckA